MDVKSILVGIVVLATLIAVGLTLWGKYGVKQGFQNPNPPAQDTFTMFYAEWCPHCKNAKPGFSDFMAGGTIDLGDKKVKVEMCDAEKEPEKTKGLPVNGFPTFLLQKTTGEVVEYKGDRSAEGYLQFLNKELGVKA
jgi:thiol-disulfide isomerase/thioredoxin